MRYIEEGALSPLKGQISSKEQELLDTINSKVAAAESLKEILSFIFETSRPLFPCDRISISFLEDQQTRVVSRWVVADYSPLLLKEGYSEGVAGTSLLEVISRGVPRLIDDLAEYAEKKPTSISSRLLLKEGVRSSMTCPLLVEGRVVGLLFRSSREPHAYDLRQVMLHSQMAERLSQAVEKAYRIEQLEATNHAYMEMLRFATHELKSPLGSIIMQGDLLLGGYLGKLEEKQASKVEGIIANARLLLTTVKDYLDLARIETGGLRLELQDSVKLLEDVIEPVSKGLAPQQEEKGIRIEFSEGLADIRSKCDPNLMRIVYLNLVGNAIKYGAEQGTIRISAELNQGVIRSSIWNEGVGFPRGQRSRLFQRFSRLTVPEFKGIKGTGVGLYTVWQIIQLHGGKVWAESEYGSWAEFKFELPQGD